MFANGVDLVSTGSIAWQRLQLAGNHKYQNKITDNSYMRAPRAQSLCLA